MKKIPLTRGKFVLVDDGDYEEVSKHSWSADKTPHDKTWYARSSIKNLNGKYIKTALHIFIMNPQKGKVVDHINGEGLDCQRHNMRVCTHSDNQHNRKWSLGKKTSKFKGVSWNKNDGVWRAFIYLNWKQIYLGRFSKEVDAAKAYDSAARKYFGVFSKLNFPEKA